MRAAVAFTIPSDRLEIAEFADLEPKDDQVLVDVEACGICGTDIHILDGTSYRPATPAILGHEPVGTIVAAGRMVQQTWLGKRVAVSIFAGCRECALCRQGDERLCINLQSIVGVADAQGGFAERLAVASAQLVDVPENLSSPAAAALVDSGATAVNAVRVAIDTAPRSVTVAGAGAVGFLVAELLRAKGIPLEIVQPSSPRRLALQALGHRVFKDPSQLSRRPDVVIDCSGSPTVVPWALDLLQPQGLLVAAGYSTVPTLDMAPVARKELAIRGVRSGTRDDLAFALGAVASGSIRAPELRMWPLQEINAAFAAVRSSQPGKAVIVIQG